MFIINVNFQISCAYDEYVCVRAFMSIYTPVVCVEVKGQSQVSVLAFHLQTGSLFLFCPIIRRERAAEDSSASAPIYLQR